MISKALGADSQLLACFARSLLWGEGAKAALGILSWTRGIKAIGFVRNSPGHDIHPTHAVALQIAHRTARAVYRQLVKIGTPKSADLRVGIREQSTLQKRIIGEVDARNQVAGMERGLLGLCKEIDRVSIEHHPPNHFDGDNFLGNDFRRV